MVINLFSITVYALSISFEKVQKAIKALPQLAGCQVHSTVMLSEVDRKIFRKLGI
ncbi:MAG: DUF1846 family protein, partial [Clostridia bacterium]|nr:DUF1846 family protein [Clostridia bacterium]